MHFLSVLTVALFSASQAAALPGAVLSPGNSNGLSLGLGLSRRSDDSGKKDDGDDDKKKDPTCPGDQTYDGWAKQCRCEKGLVYDDHYGKCHYPAWPKPDCPKDTKAYCSKAEKDYVEYDDKKEECFNDGHNKAYCAADKDKDSKAKDKTPDAHPACAATQIYDGDDKTCKCPKGKEWRDNVCKYPKLPLPVCQPTEKAYCAKDKSTWYEYDDKKDGCDDNDKHISFCVQPGKEQAYCNSKWDT